MKVSTNSTDSQGATAEDRDSFGAFLSAARHRAGRSLEDIASTTKVRKSFLEALEGGHVEVLPEGIYRRAILRNYAAAIGLDPTVALERFDRAFSVRAPSEEHDTSPVDPVARPAPGTPQRARLSALAESWRSARSIELPASHLAAAMAAMTVVIVSQFVLHVDNVESTVSPTARADRAIHSAPAAITGTELDPSIGTGGHVPVEPVVSTAIARKNLDIVERADPGGGTPTAAEPHLVVTSNPAGARVTVNGIAWGVTPVTIRYLPPGPKTIRVTKDGYVGRERHVNVPAGETAAVQLTLLPR